MVVWRSIPQLGGGGGGRGAGYSSGARSSFAGFSQHLLPVVIQTLATRWLGLRVQGLGLRVQG